MRTIFLASLAILIVSSQAQAADFDADSLDEAIGMIKTTELVAEKLSGECVSRFPVMKEQIFNDLTTWHRNESDTPLKVNSAWSKYDANDPTVQGLGPWAERKALSLIAMVEDVPVGKGQPMVEKMCVSYFGMLASGAKRRNSPRAYKFIDDMNR